MRRSVCPLLPMLTSTDRSATRRGEFSNSLTWHFKVLCLLAIGLYSVAAMAQNSGTIQGIVTDAQGAVIAGATVQALDDAKGVVVRNTTTNAEGLFVLQPLQPGTYSVRVEAKGMKNMERRKLTLDNRQVLSLGELKLEIGSTTENVTVEAVTPLVEIGTADHSDVIDSKLVSETSMNGRDFQSLVRTLPGVVSNDSSDFRLAFNNTNAFHVNGLRGSDNNFFLDGAINTDVGANDGQFTQLSMDAVGEFKIQSNNFAAEYGRNPGVLLAVNTKAGTKQFHGTLYEFHREDAFDATPPTQSDKNYIRFNQFGGNIGGPIPFPHYKNKLFFFFNYEGTRGIRPGNTWQHLSGERAVRRSVQRHRPGRPWHPARICRTQVRQLRSPLWFRLRCVRRRQDCNSRRRRNLLRAHPTKRQQL